MGLIFIFCVILIQQSSELGLINLKNLNLIPFMILGLIISRNSSQENVIYFSKSGNMS